jgi:chemotaxis signal transduction protein
MKNIEMNVEGDKLIIVVDLKQEFGLSSSGKSITVASTEGNVAIPNREEIKVGLNVYKPRPRN